MTEEEYLTSLGLWNYAREISMSRDKLMEILGEYAALKEEKAFMAGWEAKDKGMFSSNPSEARPELAFKHYKES